jgi:hypothetical protein
MARGAGYRCEATSVAGFIQQLAVGYVRNRYVFYVMGQVREGRDPRVVDAKIIEKYGINVSKAERHRRKAAGRANMQYLRLGRTYLILATHGRGRFFDDEGRAIRDARRVPIKCAGYAVGYRGEKVRVRIEEGTFRRLAAYFLDVAARRPASALAAELRALPFEPYAPVRYQLFGLLNRINLLRKAAGLAAVPDSAVRTRRRICRPFEPGDGTTGRPGPAPPAREGPPRGEASDPARIATTGSGDAPPGPTDAPGDSASMAESPWSRSGP